MARILGLDLGAHTVKALLVETTLRGTTVRSYAHAKVEAETGLKGALLALKENHQLAADQVVVAAPGCGLSLQAATLPFADARRVEATIGFEIEGQLPYDMSEVVFDHQVLQVHDGKSEVLVATLRKQELTDLLAMLTEVGIDPRVVTSSAATYQTLLATGSTGQAGPAPEGSEAIVDLGHDRTSVLIGVSKGATEYARTFSGGGANLTRAVAADFNVSFLDAETWKENEGDVDLPADAPQESKRAAAALTRGLAPLVRELRATFRAHTARTRKSVARIYLTGGTARLKGVAPWLAQQLGVEVQPLEPFPPEASSVVTREQGPVASQAYALSLRTAATQRISKLNLRQGEFAFKGDLDYLRGKTSRLAAFAAILVFLALVSVWARFRGLSSREDAVDQILCHTTQRVLGTCQKDYLVTLSLLKGKGSPAAAIPKQSALDLFADLSTRLDPLNVKIEEAEVQLDRVRFKGETESFDAVDKIVSALGTNKCFHDIKRGKVEKRKGTDKVGFDLDIRVDCPEPGARPEGA